MDILRIIQLPEDLVGEILQFISLETLSLSNKKYWKEHYKKKLNTSSNTQMGRTSYWRFLLRFDYSFIFRAYLEHYFSYFIKQKRIINNINVGSFLVKNIFEIFKYTIESYIIYVHI